MHITIPPIAIQAGASVTAEMELIRIGPIHEVCSPELVVSGQAKEDASVRALAPVHDAPFIKLVAAVPRKMSAPPSEWPIAGRSRIGYFSLEIARKTLTISMTTTNMGGVGDARIRG